MSNNIAIIGAGPAGIATALQLKRYGINVLVLEADKLGGLLHNASKVENYLGFSQGISGPDLVAKFSEQLDQHKIKVSYEKVHELTLSANDILTIATDKNIHQANIVVIASGTVPKTPNIVKSLNTEISAKIFYEVAKMPKITNKNIAIIGAGDAAFDYAITLSKKNHVTIFNRGTEITALPVLQNYVRNLNNVGYSDNANLVDISNSTNELRLKFALNDTTQEHDYDYLLFAIGRTPCKAFYSPDLVTQESNLITNKQLYLVGDIKNGIYRQASLAIADGIKAAMEIHKHFRGKNK